MIYLRTLVVGLLLAVLAGCGGGGGGQSTSTSTQLAQICAPENPFVQDAEQPTKRGSLTAEKNWVKAYMTERYLWYKDIPTVDAKDAKYSVYTNGVLNVGWSLSNYFDDLLTPLKTSSGSAVDKFSFMTTTAAWNSFDSGIDLGYGYVLKAVDSLGKSYVKVAYVYPNSAASAAGMRRGDQIDAVDGLSVGYDLNNVAGAVMEGLYPTRLVSHSFQILRNGQNFTVVMMPSNVSLRQADHRVINAGNTKVGYLLFNSHIPSAEQYLIQAANEFKQSGVTELVVDMRYNGGGYLAIASALAGAVAGKPKAEGRTFAALNFSDKRSAENESMGFLFAGTNNQPFPTLNLSKVYVLATNATCSASEAFVNGLRGIDVQVEIIGTSTCGKPYGFMPQDNCGITYAAMEFESVNAKGEGRYSDGMAPQCQVGDDLSHELGDSAEGMLAVALKRIQGQTCSQATAAAGRFTRIPLQNDGRLIRPEWQSNTILSRKH